MSILETLVIAFLAFSAFCALVEAVKQVLVARATPPACPCRDLHSVTLTAGSVFELQPGTVIPPTTEADPRVVAISVATRAAGEVH